MDDDDWLIPDDVDAYTQPMKKYKRGSTPLKRIDPGLAERGVSPDTSFSSVACTSGTEDLRMRAPAFRIRVKINEHSFIFAVPER